MNQEELNGLPAKTAPDPGPDIQSIELDIDMIRTLHREQDSYVALCRKINQEHQDLAGVKVSDLNNVLPFIVEWLLEDAYVSINASYRAAPYDSTVTGLPAPWRAERHLKVLNACYVDLDCYKTGLGQADAEYIVTKAQDAGQLPPASIIARTGRGLGLLWLLKSERRGAYQTAYPNEVELYKQINRAKIERTNRIDPKLNADTRAYDAARIARIPGSIHSGAGKQVLWRIQVTREGIPTYTLKELASYYGIPTHSQGLLTHRTDDRFLRPIKNPGSAPNRIRGRMKVGANRVLDTLTIYQHIRGFEHGYRRRSLTFFCYFAKDAGLPLNEIEEKAFELAAGCRPAYPHEDNDTPLKDLVENVWLEKPRVFRNDKLAKFFKITPELADELNLLSIIPEEVREARAAQPGPQEAARRERHKALKAILKKGAIPSVRRLQKQLEAKGIEADHTTIFRDLKKMVPGY